MRKWIRRFTCTELALIYLVILIGSIVRTTGSGMGCPDWPKCFGYLVPPTKRTQLEWQTQRKFKKGQIIIVSESLKVAQKDFTTSQQYNPENWMSYTKHDYATFNVFHTWTEYINRLVGAFSGFSMFLLLFLSLLYLKKDQHYALLSAISLFLLGFEAWLGKLVVDGNLIPGSITIHMLGALSIVAVLIVMIGFSNRERLSEVSYTPLFWKLLWIALAFTLVQIILGTQVREQIDHLYKTDLLRKEWVENLNWRFYAHQFFSLLILAINAWLCYLNHKLQLWLRFFSSIMAILLAQIIVGIILTYFHFPKVAQPIHLMLSTLLFGAQWYGIVVFLLAKKVRVLRVQ